MWQGRGGAPLSCPRQSWDDRQTRPHPKAIFRVQQLDQQKSQLDPKLETLFGPERPSHELRGR